MLALTEAGLVGVKEPLVGHLENLILEIVDTLTYVICVGFIRWDFTPIYSVSPSLLTKVSFVSNKKKNNNNLSNVTSGFYQGLPREVGKSKYSAH